MPSLDSIERAIETRHQLTEMGNKARFHVRKWVSNLTEVLADVPEEDRASEVNLEKNELPVTKTLGVSWTAREDQEASIALHTFSDASERAYTAAVYSRHEYQDGSKPPNSSHRRPVKLC